MPVLGHAFVGLATAACVQPLDDKRRATALWVPSVVLLAYLPDIVSQLASTTGFVSARMASHSVIFAIPYGVLLGVALARLGTVQWTVGIVVAVVSVVGHILLDLLVASDRIPLWPIVLEPLGGGWAMLPRNGVGEILIFGFGYVVAVSIVRRRLTVLPGTVSRAGLGIVVCLFVAAGGTHWLRSVRFAAFVSAKESLAIGQHETALTQLDAAMLWPSINKESRADYMKAEANRQLGNTEIAELHYARAYAAEPDDFWIVADYALFRATHLEPCNDASSSLETLVDKLNRHFSHHPRFKDVLRKIDTRRNARSIP